MPWSVRNMHRYVADYERNRDGAASHRRRWRSSRREHRQRCRCGPRREMDGDLRGCHAIFRLRLHPDDDDVIAADDACGTIQDRNVTDRRGTDDIAHRSGSDAAWRERPDAGRKLIGMRDRRGAAGQRVLVPSDDAGLGVETIGDVRVTAGRQPAEEIDFMRGAAAIRIAEHVICGDEDRRRAARLFRHPRDEFRNAARLARAGD